MTHTLKHLPGRFLDRLDAVCIARPTGDRCALCGVDRGLSDTAWPIHTETGDPVAVDVLAQIRAAETPRPDHRAMYIAGLRELADFLADHPGLPLPSDDLSVPVVRGTDEEERVEVDRIAAVLGVEAREGRDGTAYEAAKTFGPVGYRAIAITSERMAAYNALSSYHGSVRP